MSRNGLSLKGLTNLKTFFPSIIASVALLIIGQILSPGFADISNIGNLLTVASILAIATIGQALIITSGGEGIDMSLGAIMSMGALIGPMISKGQSGRIILMIAALVLIGGIIGFINGFGSQIIKIPPLVMTLIMASVVNGLTLGYTNGQPSVTIPPALLGVGKRVFGPVRVLLIIAILAIVLMELVLRKTKFGKLVYLVGSNRNAAKLAGTNVNIVAIASYVLGGIIAALAGMFLVGYAGSGQLQMANDYTLLSIAAVVIGGTKLTGGKGTLVGGALGAIVLVLLTSILVAIGMPAGVRSLIQGIILLVILVILYIKAPKLRQ
ncbi:MAG: ABC transporter permease [Bacillota bacterium]|nr:ABC transporter permease [Bacillota bacterium]